MHDSLLLYQIALTLVPQIGTVQARILSDHFSNARDIFFARKSSLERIEGIGEIRASAIKSYSDFSVAEKELDFIEKYKITPLFLTDKHYPRRLLNCYDPPTMLYYRGKADLNASKIIAIVGTRNKTDYGKHLTEQLIRQLATENILVISGLAFGIDAIAHKACVKHHLPTVGVLAHGLDDLYPQDHSTLAKDMIKHGGGLLTEFMHNTTPDRHNFPTRNRIVAGMSDATIVVETDVKGGSMITAELANSYNKDVFAFPGRVSDNKSAGCNYLIKNNKAILLTDAQQLMEIMGWIKKEKPKKQAQKELFIQLSENERRIVSLLQEKELLNVDELHQLSGLSSSNAAAAILSLELQNVLVAKPGKMFALL